MPERLAGLTSGRSGYGGALTESPPERSDLIRLAAATEVLLAVADRLNGEIADEAILAELYELRDRAHSALARLGT
jgi:hypothetical protein